MLHVFLTTKKKRSTFWINVNELLRRYRHFSFPLWTNAKRCNYEIPFVVIKRSRFPLFLSCSVQALCSHKPSSSDILLSEWISLYQGCEKKKQYKKERKKERNVSLSYKRNDVSTLTIRCNGFPFGVLQRLIGVECRKKRSRNSVWNPSVICIYDLRTRSWK